jgi:hypothetical protein
LRIKEIITGVYCYIATVKAKRSKSLSKAKTVVFADGISQARALLAVMYGDENVVSVTRISEIEINETVPNRTKPVAQRIPRVLPTEYTHTLAQKALLNQMKRNALHANPTIDDLNAAQSDFETEKKRVNREYEAAANDRLKWAEIRKRWRCCKTR